MLLRSPANRLALILLLSLVPCVARAHNNHVHYMVSAPVVTQEAATPDEAEDSEIPSNRVITPAQAFQPFSSTVRVRSNGRTLFIESNGLPGHNMMVGIRSWQQQVPLPQPYMGDNAWQIPLKPRLAANPISAKTNLFRGAIAIAVNGVPIFNALNNRKEDALLAGELDQWGGHCGRGDDYHYHTAPVHLEKIVGRGNPIAYALDGFPIYGETEADGSPVGKLDEFNGQFDADGNYHYHATQTYPYINGGMRGEVNVRGGQVDPQPRDSPLRPPGKPLRGATITHFERKEGRYLLEYQVAGQKASIAYAVKNGNVEFDFKDRSGKVRTESYRWSRDRGETLPVSVIGEESANVDSLDENASASPGSSIDNMVASDSSLADSLTVSSSAVGPNGEIDRDFTCDGFSESPPISWSPGPEGTVGYALSFWHVPGQDEIKSYWLLYDIPAEVTSIPRNVSGVGKMGRNDKDRLEYDPICSRGPGTKEYHVTIYALSEQPVWSGEGRHRADMLDAIADITLAQGTTTFRYTRSGGTRWLSALAVLTVVGVIVYLTIFRRRRVGQSAGG